MLTKRENPQIKKKSSSYHIDDYMKQKIPLEKKIEQRNKETYTNNDLWMKIRLKSRNKDQERINQGPIFYNHLTPNRDLKGFDFFFKGRGLDKSIRKYYNNIVYGNI